MHAMVKVCGEYHYRAVTRPIVQVLNVGNHWVCGTNALFVIIKATYSGMTHYMALCLINL